MAVFLVRVILFLMSRQVGPADATSVVDAPTDEKSGRRPPTRLTAPKLAPGDMGYDNPQKNADSGVTREEMVKLFGSALRVR